MIKIKVFQCVCVCLLLLNCDDFGSSQCRPDGCRLAFWPAVVVIILPPRGQPAHRTLTLL